MDLEVPLDFEYLISLAAVAVSNDGWTEVGSPQAGLSVWRQEDTPTTVLLRTRFELPMPPEDAVNLFRPEVFFNEARKLYDHEVHDCGLIEQIAPGDALGFTLLNRDIVTPQVRKAISLLGTLNSCRSAINESDDDYGVYTIRQIRLSVRRDTPEPGMFAIARAPRNPKTLKLLWEWGISKASVGVFEASSDNSKTYVTEVLRYDRRAVLTTEVLADAPRVLTFFKLMEEKLCGYRDSDVFFQSIFGSESYSVLTLRRCERGPPLLPSSELVSGISNLATEWRQADKYELPMYLRKFLDCIGLQDVAVYDSIDGRGLMPYQAVVRKCSWDFAWPILINFWGQMQAAYRHTLGGVNAPQLKLGTAPRFTQLQDVQKPMAPPGLEVEVSVHRTFMHFSGTDLEREDCDKLMNRPRAASESEVGGCAQS